MPRRALLAAVVLLLVAACGEQSNVDRDAKVTVGGTVEAVDGTPLSSRAVRLGSGVSNLEGAMGFLSVGLFCLSGECSGDFFDTQSGDDGSYAFELTGADTQSTFGEAVSFLLSTSGEPRGEHPTGPAMSARFRIQTEDLTLPTLRLVDPGLKLGPEGTTVSATWDGTAAPAPYTVAYATPDGLPVWQATVTEPTATVDGRVLEDVTGLVTVSGSRTDEVEGSEVQISWRSSSLAFRGGFGAAPSRGAACELHSSSGVVLEVDDCGLADGAFEPAGLPPTVCPRQPATSTATNPCSPVERVRLRLSEPVAADLLVVRGCTDACRVAVVGADGEAATDVGPVSGPFATMALGGAPVTAVDIVTDDPTGLTEVSVWAPAREGPALLPIDDPAAVGPGDADDEDRDRRAVAAVAAVLVVGALVLLVLVRRSRRAAA